MKKPAPASPLWTGPRDIGAKLTRDWDVGKIPAFVVRAAVSAQAAAAGQVAAATQAATTGQASATPLEQESGEAEEALFPLRVPLKGPSAKELGASFDQARAWIAELVAAEGRPGFYIEWRDVNHRQLGQNRIPAAVIFETIDDVLRYIGKKRDAERLGAMCRAVMERCPALYPWLQKRPLEALARGDEWPAILAAIDWFIRNPRSGRYLRQVDAPGVHSKFIETRRGLMSELLDLALEPEAIEAEATGSGGFIRRYGLIDKPLLVRIRSLDASAPFTAAGPGAQSLAASELAMRASDFARLYTGHSCPFTEVFITENEINFLAFPARHNAAVILGAGYGFVQLAEAPWLHGPRLRYWGDIDTHGFAILDQFRALFPFAESFLMDRQSLLEHQKLWTLEPSPTRAELSRLRPEEATLYDDLRNDRLGPSIRLEQERLRFSWVEAALE